MIAFLLTCAALLTWLLRHDDDSPGSVNDIEADR